MLEVSPAAAQSPPTNPIPAVPQPPSDAAPAEPAGGVEVQAPGPPDPPSAPAPAVVPSSTARGGPPTAPSSPPPVQDPDAAWWLPRPGNDAEPVQSPRTDPIPVQSPRTDPIPVQSPRRARKMIFGGLLAVALLAATFVVTRWGPGEVVGGALGRDERRAAVAGDGVRTAELNVVTGAETLTIVADGEPGGDLAVATAPAQSRAIPVLELDGARLTLATRDDGRSVGPVDVTVRLARDVRWSVVVDGGARRLLLDLSAGQVAAVDVNEGIGELEARFPRPVGEVRTRIGGGAGTVEVHVPDGVPARATFSEGAGDATLDGEYRDGVAAGATLTGEGWTAADDRIDVVLDSGVGSVTVQGPATAS